MKDKLLNERLRLKPWLKYLSIDTTTSVIFSETTTYSLKGKSLAAILPLLDGTRSEDDIADELAGRISLSDIYYHLIQLKERDLIEPVPAGELHPRQIFYKRMGGDPARLAKPQDVMVTSVGGGDAERVAQNLALSGTLRVEVADWESRPLDSGAFWITVTPDYLDPGLEAFNRRALAAGTRWLPIKPDGIEPWMGPLVGLAETGCMECLLHRLRGHRVLEIQHLREKGQPQYLSQGVTGASLDALCSLLVLELEKLLTQSPDVFIQKGVLALNLKSLEIIRHELRRRPYCPACGESNYTGLAGLPETRITLTSQTKASYKDGGERIKAAAETIDQFKTRISPITGEVGSLKTREDLPACFGFLAASTYAAMNRNQPNINSARLAALGVSAGKGRTEIQARASALGEALERYSTQYFGYEQCLRAPFHEVADNALHPRDLNPFSDSQYRDREDWGRRAETGRVPELFDEHTPIDWTPAWSLTHERWRWVPSAIVYYSYPEPEGGKYCYADSNGVASGNCIEEAIVQGFFELVEREGVALWWYNMLQRPSLDLKTFGSRFALEAAAGLDRMGYTLDVLDLTTDLGIPVFAAIALHGTDPGAEPVLGFGAHFDQNIALERAVSEIGQSWSLDGHISPNEINRKTTGRSLSTEPFLRPLEGASPVSSISFTNLASDDFAKDVETCISLLDKHGLEMLVVDLTRPDVGLAVARVLVPGMVHFWPRFGAKRLYDLPVKLGWMDQPKVENDLNPVPFYF